MQNRLHRDPPHRTSGEMFTTEDLHFGLASMPPADNSSRGWEIAYSETSYSNIYVRHESYSATAMSEDPLERYKDAVPDSAVPPRATMRWVDAVSRLAFLPKDVATLTEWGKEIGKAQATLKAVCHMVD